MNNRMSVLTKWGAPRPPAPVARPPKKDRVRERRRWVWLDLSRGAVTDRQARS